MISSIIYYQTFYIYNNKARPGQKYNKILVWLLFFQVVWLIKHKNNSNMNLNDSEKEIQEKTRVGLDFVTIQNRILKLNF